MVIACWGVLGVLGLVARAIVRLAPLAIEPIEMGMLSLPLWALYIGWILFNAYAEGYRGFQRSFSPRVVARAVHLGHNPRVLHVALAPLFCMGLFHAKRRRLIAAWSLLIGIVMLIVLIRLIPQPWRGIVDAGVVVGLVWGELSIIVIAYQALIRGLVPEHDSLPDEV